MKAVIEDGVRRAICCWHRRAGKDKTFLNVLAIKAIERFGNYAYYFPTATLGRRALWQAIDANSGMKVIDHLPKELVAKKNEQQMLIELVNGSTIQILGTETLDVVGGNPIGVMFSESAQHNPLAWDYIRPILRENGGWAIFNGTPRGKNWFYRLIESNKDNPEWFVQVAGVDATGALSEADIESERKAGMRPEMIRQEYYCDFNVGQPGSIFAEQIQKARDAGRVVSFDLYDRSQMAWTAWDLGSPENMATWVWQWTPAGLRILGFIGAEKITLAQRVARLMAMGCVFAGHILPHDGDQRKIGEITFRSELQKLGLANLLVLPMTRSVWHGINRMHDELPRCQFASPACDHGLAALEAYHCKVDEATGYATNEPEKDWSSHPADAFRYIGEALMQNLVGPQLARFSGEAPKVKLAGNWA